MSVAALLTLLVAAVVAALCSAADGALLVEHVEQAPGALGFAARERTHRALAFARLAAHLVAGASAALALRLTERPRLEGTLLGVAAAVAIVLAAESVPRSVGDAVGGPLLRALSTLVRAVELALRPVVVAGTRLDAALRRAFPVPEADDESRDTSTEQFRQVVEAAADVPRDQQAILHGVFSLGETEVQEIMVPRVNILAVGADAPWSEVVDRVRSAEHARLPVYDDDIDNIVGILYAKDVLAAMLDDGAGAGGDRVTASDDGDSGEPAGGWRTLLRPPAFIPEGKTIDAQLRDFKASRTHIAIVVDEYGGTAGLVTIEDILEEIVGEIRDEHDREERPIESEAGQRFWVSGRVTLDDLSDAVGQRLERDGVTTVSGLVYSLLGRVPRAGERLTFGGFRIVVERVVRRRIERVYLERAEGAERPERVSPARGTARPGEPLPERVAEREA